MALFFQLRSVVFLLLPVLVSTWSLPFFFTSNYPLLYLFKLMPNPLSKNLYGRAALQTLCEIVELPTNSTNSSLTATQPWSLAQGRNLSAAALFQDIVIGHGWATILWDQAEQIVDELAACPAALQSAKTFTLNMWPYDFDPYIPQMQNYPKPDKPARKSNLPSKCFPGKLASLLSSMSYLEDIKLEIPQNTGFKFEKAFHNASTSLPAVKKLTTTAEGAFMMNHCESLQSLAITGWRGNHSQFIEQATTLKNLKSIELGCHWNTNLSELIVQKLPELEHLGITDRLAYSYERGNGLAVHLPILTNLSKLKTLRLPDATSVGVSDFDGGPWCGNAFMHEDGSPDEEFIQQIADQWREAEDEAATLVGKAFGSGFVEVQLGDAKFRFERDESGEFLGLIGNKLNVW